MTVRRFRRSRIGASLRERLARPLVVLVLAASAGVLPLIAVAARTGEIAVSSSAVANGTAVRFAVALPSSIGYEVAPAGDVNGDRVADLLVGERHPAGLWFRSVYVVFGGKLPAGTNVALGNLGEKGYRISDSKDLIAWFANAGDVNGDGRSDVVTEGSYVPAIVFGQRTAVDIDVASLGSRGYRILGVRTGALGGDYTMKPAVAGAGDVNRDGLADVVLAAKSWLGSPGGSGIVDVVFGKRDTSNVDLNESGSGFRILAAADPAKGVPAVGAGDVNRDGRGDLLVGVPGAAYVVFGTSTAAQTIDVGDLGVRGYRIELPQVSAGVLPALSAAGDVNRDGRGDVVIGVPRGTSGAAYVVFGKESETPLALDALGEQGYRISGSAGDAVGATVAGAGDVNRDGRPDVLVGAPGAKGGQGSLFVVFGKNDPSTVELAQLAAQGFRVNGDLGEKQAGASVAGPGDLDGDRYGEVLLGTREGSAWLVWSRFPLVTYTKLSAVVQGGTVALRGVVHPRGLSTRAFVEWGATTRYGTRTTARSVGNGTVPVTFAESLPLRRARLVPGRTYHFRVVATNAFFGTAYGADRTFIVPTSTPLSVR